MAKRNRWLVGTVLTVALAAFLSLSLLPLLGGIGSKKPSTGNASSNPSSDPAAVQAELESQAHGYTLVLEREPDNQTALKGLVETRIQLKDLQGVVDPLEKLAKLNPDVADYTVLLAQTKQQLGDLEGAAQSYRSILDQQPGNMKALQGLVALLLQQQRPQAAIGLLQDTLDTATQLTAAGDSTGIDTLSVNLLLAQVYVEDGSIDQAMALYDTAIQTAPDDFRPVLAKALVLQQQGQADQAKPLFAQAEAMAPAAYKDQIAAMAKPDNPPAATDSSESPNPTATDSQTQPADSPQENPE